MLKKYLPNCYLVGLLVIAFLIRIYLFIRRKEDATTLDTYNIVQIGITFFLGLLLLIRQDVPSIVAVLIRSPIGWLLLLFVFGILSGFWSSLPLFSSYFGLEGLVYIVALALIFWQQTDNQSMEKLAIYSSYLLIAMMILGLIKLNGFSLNLYHWHTNSYSAVASMLFGYCFGEYNNQAREINIEESKLLKKGIWISFFLVALGTSSASNISLAASVVIIILISGRPTAKIVSLILLVLFVLVNQLYGDLLFKILFPGKTLEGVELMTGRMNLWEYYFSLIQQKPIAGWGFAALSRISKLYNIHTHNSLIEITGGVGIIGLIIFVLYLVRVYYRLLINVRAPYIVGVISAISAGMINGMSISFIGSPTGAIFIAFIIWNLLGWYNLIKLNFYFDTYNEENTFFN